MKTNRNFCFKKELNGRFEVLFLKQKSQDMRQHIRIVFAGVVSIGDI
ncbi:MAG: hypothetical protein ACJARX_001885 [Psychroserpens sp.]